MELFSESKNRHYFVFRGGVKEGGVREQEGILPGVRTGPGDWHRQYRPGGRLDDQVQGRIRLEGKSKATVQLALPSHDHRFRLSICEQ